MKQNLFKETIAKNFMTACGFVSILAILSITIYMFISGIPALLKVGIKEILFSTVWAPTSTQPQYGILYIILTSLIGTILAVLLALPIGVLTAVALSELCSKKLKTILKSAIELLAGIPSVVYGLLGILIINPLMYELEKIIFQNSTTHQYSGGANFISAILVLTIMILPTLINISETAIESVPQHYRTNSYALGATQIQTIFKVVLPASKNGIISAIILGVGRALGEAMAILLVAGNSVNLPLPFASVRFLTTAIVSEMSYSSGIHRQVLFTIGLVLFIFIMIINLILNYILTRGNYDE
jgi:phosphate transport system permease protein